MDAVTYGDGWKFADHVIKHGRFLVRDNKCILDQLLPGAMASCDCERRAMEYMWSRQSDGVLTSRYISNGTYEVGVKGMRLAGEPIMKVFHIQHSLTADKLNLLKKDFSDIYFVTGGENHDHVCAHTSTRKLTSDLADRICRLDKDVRVLDIYGNPAANLKSNKRDGPRIDTVVEKILPKDFVRAATKWGDLDAVAANGGRTYVDSVRNYTTVPIGELAEQIEQYSIFVAVHTLYYLSKEEIASLLSKRRGSKLYAIVHRFLGDEGSFWGGEIEWFKTDSDHGQQITQLNVLTNESYDHPDNSWLFNGGSWHNDLLGMGWTTQYVASDTFLVTMTSVPVPQCRMDVAALRRDLMPQARVDDNTVTVCVQGKQVVVDNVDKAAFKDMCAHVSGKARTADQFRDHLAATKRKMAKSKTLGTRDAANTAVASFFMSMEKDKDVVGGLMALTVSQRGSFRHTLSDKVPLGTLNILDKILGVGVLVAASHGQAPHKTVSAVLRMTRGAVASHGTNID
jgi:hypothetical protein